MVGGKTKSLNFKLKNIMQQVYKIFAPIWIENVSVQLVQPIAQFPTMEQAMKHFNKEVLPFTLDQPPFELHQTMKEYMNTPEYQEYVQKREEWEQEYPARVWSNDEKKYVSPSKFLESYIQAVWVNQSV